MMEDESEVFATSDFGGIPSIFQGTIQWEGTKCCRIEAHTRSLAASWLGWFVVVYANLLSFLKFQPTKDRSTAYLAPWLCRLPGTPHQPPFGCSSGRSFFCIHCTCLHGTPPKKLTDTHINAIQATKTNWIATTKANNVATRSEKRIEIHHNTPEQKHLSKSCNLSCFQALTRHHQTTTAGLTSLGHQLSDCCRGNNFQLVWLGLRGYLGRGRKKIYTHPFEVYDVSWQGVDRNRSVYLSPFLTRHAA